MGRLALGFLPVNRLREWREKRGLTQTALADASGVSERTIIRYEGQSTTRFDYRVLEALAKALQIKPSQLIE